MCKYCNRLKELRNEEKRLFEMRKKFMDKSFLRKERLLERAYDLIGFWYAVFEDACCNRAHSATVEYSDELVEEFDYLMIAIKKELEREVI